jgi:hypothetical protein
MSVETAGSLGNEQLKTGQEAQRAYEVEKHWTWPWASDTPIVRAGRAVSALVVIATLGMRTRNATNVGVVAAGAIAWFGLRFAALRVVRPHLALRDGVLVLRDDYGRTTTADGGGVRTLVRVSVTDAWIVTPALLFLDETDSVLVSLHGAGWPVGEVEKLASLVGGRVSGDQCQAIDLSEFLRRFPSAAKWSQRHQGLAWSLRLALAVALVAGVLLIANSLG